MQNRATITVKTHGLPGSCVTCVSTKAETGLTGEDLHQRHGRDLQVTMEDWEKRLTSDNGDRENETYKGQWRLGK